MRLLVLVHEVGNTASGIVSQRVIEELDNRGHEIVVVTSRSTVVDSEKIICCNDLISSGTFFSRAIDKLKRIVGLDTFNSNFSWRLRAYYRSLRIVSQWRPDFIYCRTSPIDPCFVGIRLKNRFKIPLLVNLTDPLPPPTEYLANEKIRAVLSKSASFIMSNADLVSMGTEQALIYQERITGIDISSKSFISPDPVPYDTIRYLKVNQHSDINLVYLGAIYGSRNIAPLIEAIKCLNSNGYSIKLKIYGNSRLNIKEDFIEECGFLGDVEGALIESDILVDIDGDDLEPVFVSSKLKQYLVVNRPILCITPLNSPSSSLLEDIDSIRITRNEVDSICNNISYIIGRVGTYDYNDRANLVNQLSPKVIVDNIISEVSSRLISDISEGD